MNVRELLLAVNACVNLNNLFIEFCVFFSYNLFFIFVTEKKIIFLLTEDKVTL